MDKKKKNKKKENKKDPGKVIAGTYEAYPATKFGKVILGHYPFEIISNPNIIIS